jgi:hypothetical protein
VSLPLVDVPGGLPNAGRQVRLTVINGAGTGASVFVLKPFELLRPIGSMIIAQSSGPQPGTKFTAGGTYDYVFRITADTRPDETFLVTANIARTGWSATASQSEIFIPAAANAQTPTVATLAVTVKIDPNAQNGDTGQLSVTLTAKRDPTFVWRSTPDIPIAVNATAPTPRKMNLALSTTTAGDASIRINPDNSRTAVIGLAGGGGGTGEITFTVTRVDGLALEDTQYQVDLTKLAAFRGDTSPAKWKANIAGTQGNKVRLAGASPSLIIEVTAAPGALNATMLLELTKVSDASFSGYGEFAVERTR